MPVLLMVLLDVDPAREAEVLEGFKERHAQSIRLGALSHDLWKLEEPGEETDKWMGTMTYRDMDHFRQFSAAQEADPEAAATIARLTGPSGPIKMISTRVGSMR